MKSDAWGPPSLSRFRLKADLRSHGPTDRDWPKPDRPLSRVEHRIADARSLGLTLRSPPVCVARCASPACHSYSRDFGSRRAVRRRNALPMTDTELSDIASAATTGLSRMPKVG